MREFDDTVADLHAVAFRVAYRMVGSHHDAEEVAQEVCARALVRWRKVEPYAEAWTARAAANLVIDRLRRARRWLPLRPTATPPVDADRLALLGALRALPPRQRQVVVLRYLVDLPEGEVARRLGCTVGTVKQHAHRGLAALRAGGLLAGE